MQSSLSAKSNNFFKDFFFYSQANKLITRQKFEKGYKTVENIWKNSSKSTQIYLNIYYILHIQFTLNIYYIIIIYIYVLYILLYIYYMLYITYIHTG